MYFVSFLRIYIAGACLIFKGEIELREFTKYVSQSVVGMIEKHILGAETVTHKAIILKFNTFFFENRI